MCVIVFNVYYPALSRSLFLGLESLLWNLGISSLFMAAARGGAAESGGQVGMG